MNTHDALLDRLYAEAHSYGLHEDVRALLREAYDALTPQPVSEWAGPAMTDRKTWVAFSEAQLREYARAAIAALPPQADARPAGEAVARTKAGHQWHDWQETLRRLIGDRTEKLHFAADVQADEDGVRFDNCRFIHAQPVGYISFGEYRESCDTTEDQKKHWQPVWTSKPATPQPVTALSEALPVAVLRELSAQMRDHAARLRIGSQKCSAHEITEWADKLTTIIATASKEPESL